MCMLVMMSYILLEKLKNTKTRVLRYNSYLNSIKPIKQDLLLILVLVRKHENRTF